MTRPPLLLRTYGGLANLAAPLLFRRIRDRLVAHGTSPARARERLGHATLPRPAGRLIWIHGASVGETLSALPLITALRAQEDPPRILVTSGTASSAEIMAKRLPAGALHQFAPLDSKRALRRFHAHWQPDLLVLMESELWPQMIQTAPCPVVLLNARLSARALARWQSLGPSAAYILRRLALIVTQTEATAAGLRALGVAPDRIRTGGNLKAAAPPPDAAPAALAQITAALTDRPRWLAAATHPGEEDLLLAAHRQLLKSHPDLCLILAPRHPERGDRIAQMATGLTLTRRSAGEAPTAQVYLADTLGEMGLWYRKAPLAFVGGSLTPNGGHNPWEGAALGCALLTGSHLTNCAQDWQTLTDADAARTDLTADTLLPALQDLLATPAAARAMGARAAAVTARQGDDIARTVADLNALMPAKATP
ncbi:3-deoxy-D-manno-octulosonic acid transferase [Loktanella sp. M215]|uniref:3-deoxy-D-manno-octulosonic acid transferase n=1 Tax=Loktanella sp. M215 TaxID=2675431 RepID=UPI001F21C216|nr:3-deoxy-D-manno-octulosonic acid transferase [Loktanella sp. M215]MCF7700271.1 3-deoxy-D-manno-octulosonic acid transferase [Loktanella sp. M215]